ncbi:cation transporter [filamentous cyanobacterium LEGE 11480]|uniref:Cation transporter n=1 Tax=Romeriopsis navalis LEGE 11480 TaxID=2777977 RepID=A0A928VK93_9CYAN|nr:cation transporter [Romeriopsis navalis]MBE9030126.1 cation transporter [Romeriopsis navalis LEGE 11480]
MVAKSQRYPTTQRFLLAALWLELLALTVKVFVGWQTNSLALLATALYCAIAAVSAIYAIIATYNLQQAGRPVWGHNPWESGLAAAFIALLGFGGIILSSVALQHLAASPQLHQAPPVTITRAQLQVQLLFGMCSLGLAWLQKRWAKRFRSLALATNGDQVLRESLLSLGLLLGLSSIQQGYTWLDPVLALGLVVSAGFSAWGMFQRQQPLMVRQIAIAPEAIAQAVRRVDGVTHCAQIESRGIVGRQVLISLTLRIHPEFLGMEGRIIQSVEAILRETYGPVKVNTKVDNDWNDLQTALSDATNSNSSHSGIDL